MFKIQTLNPIAKAGLAQFPEKYYQIADSIDHPDAILVRSHSMQQMMIPDSVKIIGRAGAGVNNIPVKVMTERGIPVLNTPGANANAVRELVMAGMLLASRNICQAWNYVSQLNTPDEQIESQIEKNKKQFVGFELLGKTLGVVGLGSVGVKVANAAINFGMHVVGYDPTISVNRAWELSSNVLQAKSLEQLLKTADFITFHVPLLPETKRMINADCLHAMKNNVVILNFARDEIIDHEALLAALQANKVLSYVSDFPNPILKNHPRVINLPHLGASTKEAEENCAVMIVKEVRDFFETGAITYSVNFPTIEVPPTHFNYRLAIVNANIPNMVAQMSGKLANAKLNIVSLINKSREEIAYTLIDIDEVVTPAILTDLANITGVKQVRLIKSQKES